jgi:hypothetical protein
MTIKVCIREADLPGGHLRPSGSASFICGLIFQVSVNTDLAQRAAAYRGTPLVPILLQVSTVTLVRTRNGPSRCR